MDPLSIQMVMGSPPPLRGKMSLSNLVGRKKKSPESDKSTFRKTPKKSRQIDNDSPQTTPSRSDTVRIRRGFRPLSILTTNALIPFESETLKAMAALREVGLAEDELQGGTPPDFLERIEESVEKLSSVASQELTTLPFSNESEISLRAFLAQSKPSTDSPQQIEAPFSTLYEVPAPDISQHPAFASDPFSSQSDAPSLATTSSLIEIKSFIASVRHNSSHFTDRTSASSDAFGSTERKKYTFFDKIQTAASSPDRNAATNPELSPLAKRKPKSCPIEIEYRLPETPSIDTEKKRTGSGGLRKFSDIFKSKSNIEKLNSPSSMTVNESPSTTIKEMEKYLRTVTCSPTYPYTDNSWLPRHPKTGRFWRSRNLKCTNCVDVSCACCGRACCAYKAAVMAIETHKDNPKGREEALQKIHQITMVFPYGRELPTFLQCTRGTGDGPGCGRLVCPDCCGMCPDEICADIQCRKCKKDPWAECDWHTEMPQFLQVCNEVNIRHTV